MLEAILLSLSTAEANHGIPEGLLKAICTVESNLNPEAVNKHDGAVGKHSFGLCQVQLQTAQQRCGTKSGKDLLNTDKNIDCAARYLAYQYKRYGNWDGAVIAYNKGSWSGGKSNVYLRKVQSVRSN